MRLAAALCVLICEAAWADGLAGKALIRRDTYGVPHILAQTEEAAAFAMGYAQAEDHAVEVARRCVAARGEEAKFTGRGLDSDLQVRRLRIHELSRLNMSKLSPLMQAMMRAYAEGFNLYVEKNRSALPAWIPKLDAVDIVAQGRAQIVRFAYPTAMIDSVKRKYPENGGVSTTARLNWDAEAPWGSNMWAIAPSRSATGKAMMLGNPHQPWAALYWEAQITVPGKINFFGATFVGSPLLTTGFNEHLGWTHTVNYPDLDDIYWLRVDAERPNNYIYDGASKPLTKVEIAVEVRQTDGSLKTERRTYWDTHLGPVVHRTRDRVFALKSATTDAYAYADEWYALSKAKNWSEFHSTLKRNAIPMFNLTYADVEGNIFYLWNATVPKRPDDGTDWRLDVEGSPRLEWRGIHPTDELPQLFNPSGGYVQNCNAPPWFTSLRNVLDPSKYPSYFEAGRPLTLRQQMSLQMIESQEKFSVTDIQRLKFNSRMLLADKVKPALVAAVRATPNRSEELERGLKLMEAWDHRVDAASRGPVVFQRFWDSYSRAVAQPYERPWQFDDPMKTPAGLGDPRAAVKYFEDALRATREKYGSIDVAWGDVHRARLGSLDLPADGADGIYGLFHNVQYGEASDGKRVVGSVDPGRALAGGADGWIMTTEFTRPPTAWSILAYGQTSSLASKHATDQLRLYTDHRFKKVWFTEAEIKANLERQYRPGEI